MTINDFIKDLEEIIEENKNIDEEQLGLIYCDDTECIEEHKLRLNQYLKNCEQLVEWLEELKYLRRENEWLKLKILHRDTNEPIIKQTSLEYLLKEAKEIGDKND